MIISILLIFSFSGSLATLPSLTNIPSLLTPPNLSWEGGSLSFPSEVIKNLFINSKQYIPKNIIGTKVALYRDTIILLTPRFKRGNPCTIVSYSPGQRLTEPKFLPYPDLANHEESNCDAIQNAVDFYLDSRGFLWVLDTGIVYTMDHPKAVCPPKIICINAMNGSIRQMIELSTYINPESRFNNIVADYDTSGNAFIYVSDGGCGSIIIYDVTNSRGFRVDFPKEIMRKRTGGEALNMYLSKESVSETVLYLSYLNSPCIFSIKTSYLKQGKSEGRITKVGKKTAPMVFLGMDNGSKLYFRYQNETTVYFWDTTTPFTPELLTSVHTGNDCFIPMSVAYDQLRSNTRLLMSNYQDYVSGNCGVGAVQQIIKL